MPFGALAAAAVGVGGAIISSKMSSDSAKDQQKYASDHTFANSGNYDSSQFQFGQTVDGAQNAAAHYNALGTAAQQRDATQANYASANTYATQGNQDASSQRSAADLMMARATGATPSIAQMQADRQMQQNIAAQSSQAASARGAAGLALAGQTAATNTANGSSAISAQAQINAASERLNAEQAASGAYAGLRSGDLASQGQAAQQSQYNAQLTAQQRAQNDQFQLAQQQNAIGVQNSQLQAGIAQQGMLSGNNAATTAANLAIQQQNSANQQANVNRAATTIGNAVQMGSSALAKSPSAPQGDPSASSNSNNANATASSGQAYALPREAGGPVTPGQPYLVGEKGPELIVPNRGGTVVPNHLSQALARSYPAPTATVPLAAPDGKELHQSMDGHAFYSDAQPAAPSVANSSGKESAPPALMARKKVATPAQARKMTPEEMMAEADRQIADIKSDTARRDVEGPAVAPAFRDAPPSSVAQQASPSAPGPVPGATPPTPQQASMLHALLGTMTPEQTQVLGQALLARRTA